MIEEDIYWMKKALKLAEEGMEKYKELPIATIFRIIEKEN